MKIPDKDRLPSMQEMAEAMTAHGKLLEAIASNPKRWSEMSREEQHIELERRYAKAHQ